MNLNLVYFVFLLQICHIYCDKFYYFAYGSNLHAKRLKINSPSAERYGVAVLTDYRLDFNMYNQMWNGAVATIVEDPGKNVTGALWTLDVKDMKNLDKQEGVDQGWYYAKNVTVTTLEGEKIMARVYEEVNNPKEIYADPPNERKPSNTYLQVMIFGAVDSGLPSDYIGYLVSFATNGQLATDSIRDLLGYPFGPKKA